MPESGRPKGKLEKRETGERLARQMNGNRIWLKTFFDEEHSSRSNLKPNPRKGKAFNFSQFEDDFRWCLTFDAHSMGERVWNV